MYNLGLLLQQRGGAGDLAEAEDWYRRAADAGITGAMYDLGVLLERRGGDGDLAQAEQWWTRAAEDPRLAPQARNALATMRETRGRSK
jgi:hypothetical protein